MNQILSVEMPRNNKRTNNRNYGGKKASTKSVVIFFCILLLVVGLAMIALGIFSNLNKDKEKTVAQEVKPRIDISQNASEIEIEISAQNAISEVKYSWNDDNIEQVKGNGTNTLNLNLNVPSGPNTFSIEVTDVKGIKNEYTHEYIGPDELKAILSFEEALDKFSSEKDKLKIVCKEQQIIKYIAYYYDNEEETRKEVNSATVDIEIPIKPGEHDLTVRAEYEDLTTKQISKKIYFPIIDVKPTDSNASGVIIKASDTRKITKVKINFNGKESIEEINIQNYEKTLQSVNGVNRLIVTVYNEDSVSITKKIAWEIKS